MVSDAITLLVSIMTLTGVPNNHYHHKYKHLPKAGAGVSCCGELLIS
jgi:hypothetical protein